MVTRRRKKIDIPSMLNLEEILAEELKREMFLEAGKKFRYIDDWDTVMNSVYEIPIEYNGYDTKVQDLKYLKEVINFLTKSEFDEVKRSESRKKQMSQYKDTMSMYYNIIFKKVKLKIGYGSLIHFPNLKKDSPERSKGIVLMAKCLAKDNKVDISFEKAKFSDFLIEVKPYVELLGDLYRKHKPYS